MSARGVPIVLTIHLEEIDPPAPDLEIIRSPRVPLEARLGRREVAEEERDVREPEPRLPLRAQAARVFVGRARRDPLVEREMESCLCERGVCAVACGSASSRSASTRTRLRANSGVPL